MNRTDLAADYCRKYRKTPTAAVARLLYNENPECFTTPNAARQAVRRARGEQNDKQSSKRAGTEKAVKLATFPSLPEPWEQMPDWGALECPSKATWLVLSDVHVPFHDKRAVETAIEYGLANGAKHVLLNGDTCDFYGISRWEKDPRERRFPEEVKACRQFLEYLRGKFPKGRIIFKEGNHDERLYAYFAIKAPELLGLAEIELPSILQVEKHGVEYVGDKKPVRLGKLSAIHGHEYRFAIQNPVSPSRGLYLKAVANAFCGHFHQSSQHSSNNLEANVISTWSQGCLCDLRPRYLPLNNWNHGFVVVRVADGGAFEVDNKRIIHGKAY